MKFIHGLDNLQAEHRPSVVSIGNYDGVHLGHQHVIKTLLEKSAEVGAPATVITFSPLAKEFFMPGSTPLITSIEQRARQLFALGVDQVLCINFDADFASYSPDKFVQEVLVDGLGVKYLSVGDDFRFGKNRSGDFEYLSNSGIDNGFMVSAHDTYTLVGERVSSGRVRKALASGDFALTETLLGRAYSIVGKVQLGQQLGRTLDFATANIVLEGSQNAVNGVFAVSVSIEGEEFRQHRILGVANVGTRPTVDGHENRLEVHLFDFDADIYGYDIEVFFHQKIREEQKFDSLDALKAQIRRDAENAKDYLHQDLELSL